MGKLGIRDYLCFLINEGNSPGRPGGCHPPQEFAQSGYEIVLVAATQTEAGRILGMLTAVMHLHLPDSSKHSFTAYGLDQAWRPLRFFDEVHWIQCSPVSLPPRERLEALGGIVHIHLFEQMVVQTMPGFRSYQWRSERDLTEFWASIYLSREMCCFALDWKSYFTWQPRIDSFARATSCWGETPQTATEALLSSARVAASACSEGEILIIEGGLNTTLGAYCDIVNSLEISLEFDFVTTGWVSPNYSGYGLKLLRFFH